MGSGGRGVGRQEEDEEESIFSTGLPIWQINRELLLKMIA
jgi:hypothetical protein